MTPWALSESAIPILLQHCRSRVVIEFGSGAGTDRLVNAGFEVFAIESDRQWIRQSASITLHCEIENRWYNHESVHEFLLQVFAASDVGAIIVDGPQGSIGRWGILHHWRTINTAEVILIDDVNREDEAALAVALATLTGRRINKHEHDNKAFAILIK